MISGSEERRHVECAGGGSMVPSLVTVIVPFLWTVRTTRGIVTGADDAGGVFMPNRYASDCQSAGPGGSARAQGGGSGSTSRI
jgi:hypothetical protein